MPEIFIYDDIGPDWLGMVSAKSVTNELAKSKGQSVTVRLNSPGGDVFEAQAIYNALRRHGSAVNVEIDGLAASAASYIAMAGDTVRIAENAMVMIHNAWTVTIGDKQTHEQRIGLLDKIDGIIADTYAARTGDKTSLESIREMMNAETWMTAKEAVDKGFADSIGQALNVGACVKEGRYRNAPQSMLAGELPRERERSKYVGAIAAQLIKNRLTRVAK